MVWAQGQVKWAKVAWKSSTYNVTFKKSTHPKQNFFFSANYKTLSLLSGSEALTGPENSNAKPCAIQVFLHEPLELTRIRKC